MFVPSVDAAPAPTISELLIKKLPFRKDVGAPVQRGPRCFLLEVRICSPPRNLELRRSPTTTTTVHLQGDDLTGPVGVIGSGPGGGDVSAASAGSQQAGRFVPGPMLYRLTEIGPEVSLE